MPPHLALWALLLAAWPVIVGAHRGSKAEAEAQGAAAGGGVVHELSLQHGARPVTWLRRQGQPRHPVEGQLRPPAAPPREAPDSGQLRRHRRHASSDVMHRHAGVIVLAALALTVLVCVVGVTFRMRLCGASARGKSFAASEAVGEKLPQRSPTAATTEEAGPPGGHQPQSRGIESWKAVMALGWSWLNEGEAKWYARGLVLLTVMHMLAREALFAFCLSANHAEVINAISSLHQDQDPGRVKRALFVWLAWELLVAVPIFTMLDPWVQQWFQIAFRRHCTSRVLTAYFDGGSHAYYRIKLKEAENKIDNPDQRIGEDITEIARQIYNIFTSVLSALFGSSMWATVFFNLGGPRLLIIGVSMAVLRVIIAYSGFGKWLVATYQNMLWTAADLRYALMRVRDNAETVVLSNGSSRERERSENYFDIHLQAVKENTWVSMLYYTAMGVLAHFPGLIIWLFQIPAVMSGRLGVGDAVRVHQGYDQVSKVLDFFTQNLVPVTMLQANAERLNHLLVACRAENEEGEASTERQPQEEQVAEGPTTTKPQQQQPLQQAQQPPSPATPAGRLQPASLQRQLQLIKFEDAADDTAFALEAVAVAAPGSSIFVGGVSVSCGSGQALLISGPSGLGKSSVLKALAGIWENGEGTVRRARTAQVCMLPQACYMPVGTLLEAVAYPLKVPSSASSALAEPVAEALKAACLEPLLQRWGLIGEARDWAVLLSPGERQRLGFARLFLQLELARRGGCGDVADSGSPDRHERREIIAILDESTSAMDVQVESQLYAALRAQLLRWACGGCLRAVCSVSHRPTLSRFHDSELRIGEDAESAAAMDSPEDVAAGQPPGEVLAQGSWSMPECGTTRWRHVALPTT